MEELELELDDELMGAPHMTAAAYRELAEAEESNAVEVTPFLKQCWANRLETDVPMWAEEDAHRILDKADIGPNCEHFRLATARSPTHGAQVQRVKAVRQVNRGTVLAFVGGVMMSSDRHAQLLHPNSEHCFSVPKEYLAEIGYEGADITICVHHRHNIVALMRPPADSIQKKVDRPKAIRGRSKNSRPRRAKRPPPGSSATVRRGCKLVDANHPPVQANVHVNVRPFIFIDRERGVLFLMIVAVQLVPKLHEFLVSCVQFTSAAECLAWTDELMPNY
jgi:hypothetical protein